MFFNKGNNNHLDGAYHHMGDINITFENFNKTENLVYFGSYNKVFVMYEQELKKDTELNNNISEFFKGWTSCKFVILDDEKQEFFDKKDKNVAKVFIGLREKNGELFRMPPQLVFGINKKDIES